MKSSWETDPNWEKQMSQQIQSRYHRHKSNQRKIQWTVATALVIVLAVFFPMLESNNQQDFEETVQSVWDEAVQGYWVGNEF